MSTTLHPPSDPFIVTYCGFPVRFVKNAGGNFANPVHIDYATEFTSEEDARIRLVDWQLHGNGKYAIRRKHLAP